MRRAWLVFVLIFGAGCGGEEPPLTELAVGSHHILIEVPEGWEHVNYGDNHQLRRGQARISIEQIRNRGGDLEAGALEGLKGLGEDDRRDVASVDTLTVGGNRAALIDTWDRVSHQWPKRFLFVKADYDFVVAYTMMGQLAEMEPVFDSLVGSFALADSLHAVE